LVNILKLT
jgi:hypothetical protein